MLSLLRRLFRTDGHEDPEFKALEPASFQLQYEDLLVATLRTAGNGWEFEYSPAFRSQVDQPNGIQPLIEFPDVGKIYKADELWPFFMARIPSPAQPQVRDRIRELRIDERDAVRLLREFGERSITNPFKLKSA